MNSNPLSRRDFIERTAAVTSAAILPALGVLAADKAAKRTATDQVTLGKTGLRLSRIGIGTGSNSGNVQRELGHEGFNKLIRHAYDRGLTYIDTAESYQTHEWIREAVRGIPREKLFIQTKMPGAPEKPLEVIDRYRKELDTDYLDSLLIHCMIKDGWLDEKKRLMDAFEEARAKKIIRSHGVSCHSLPALKRARESQWVNVHLVRLNPNGVWMDTPVEDWNAKSDESHVPPVVAEIKAMRAKGHGIIGMKLIGNGEFTQPEQREKSIRYAMQSGLLDAAVIGFKSTVEIDEGIERVNRALAEAA